MSQQTTARELSLSTLCREPTPEDLGTVESVDRLVWDYMRFYFIVKRKMSLLEEIMDDKAKEENGYDYYKDSCKRLGEILVAISTIFPTAREQRERFEGHFKKLHVFLVALMSFVEDMDKEYLAPERPGGDDPVERVTQAMETLQFHMGMEEQRREKKSD